MVIYYIAGGQGSCQVVRAMPKIRNIAISGMRESTSRLLSMSQVGTGYCMDFRVVTRNTSNLPEPTRRSRDWSSPAELNTPSELYCTDGSVDVIHRRHLIDLKLTATFAEIVLDHAEVFAIQSKVLSELPPRFRLVSSDHALRTLTYLANASKCGRDC